MNRWYLTLCLFLPSFPLFCQEPSAIEQQYDFVEVWGLAQQSKAEFLTEVCSYPEGICEQSLTKMGIKDGNKIPIPFSDKIIVTLRDIPIYTPEKTFPRLTDQDLQQWQAFRAVYDALGFYERQQVPFYKNAYEQKDQEAIDRLFQEQAQEFKSYGIDLNKEQILQSLRTFQQYADQFSKANILSALYHAEAKDSIQEAAIFIAPKYLNTKEDLLDFMPLLLVKKSGVQSLLASFLSNFKGTIDWGIHMDLLTQTVNNPNPFQSLLALKIADHTGFTKDHFRLLLATKMETMKEILRSEFLPKAYLDYLVLFLNKYSDQPIEQSTIKLLERL